MDILLRYAKKKTILILSTVFSGIITLLYLISKFDITSNLSNIVNLDLITSMAGVLITGIQVISYLFLIASIIITALSGVYFFKKNKQEYVILGEFIGSCINSVLLLLSIPGVNAICKVMRTTLSGDISPLTTSHSTKMISSIISAASNLKYFMYLSIIIFILNMILLLIVKKVINIEGFYFSFDEPINIKTTKEVSQSTINNIKNFLKTKNAKLIAVAIIALIGYKIYDSNLNYTTIDLTKDLNITFAGRDGQGYVNNYDLNINYDKNNRKLDNFVDTVFPRYEPNIELSNGDEVVVTMDFSKQKAFDGKIKVTGDSKIFIVEGLTEIYNKVSDIPEAVINTAESESAKEMETTYDNSSLRELHSLWFAKDKDDYSDKIIAVYKLDETSHPNNAETKTTYAITSIDDIDSKYLESSSHYWHTSRLYDSDLSQITDPNIIDETLIKEFDNYHLEKIK